ncbi:PP2C family protein-serine/threonine phosphatase [Methanoculleus horonobensis]|uniref:PP2C family protein-serine/threonine phosphatase n=1 Tax=Methanoculleus horonobensis TaxID=528314 RepID=UPI00082A50B1|nr:protein phosphatase 2C domain-containing protein [Methanoculleus horonobensis]MDD3070941.1 protein phosphatase 2C domain-containing protein [Methanoculleus horonobensis]MDD4251956.1 protein phosphatase 2C domain-containing protein [Methanoculleus horonobensis]
MKREAGLRYAALTDTGKRKQNEDAYFAGRTNGYHLFAVADGLGGHACGEVASRMAVEILVEAAGRELSESEPAEMLGRAFERINAAIFAYNGDNALNAGTTLSAAVVGESGRCWIGTVGDSRTHIVTPTSVWHTRDQTYVQGLVESGAISPAEAMLHPRKNVLTQALGLSARVRVDLDIAELAGGVLLVSSDGLHDYVPESAIQKIVLENAPDTACRRLLDAARDAASTDNTTVIVARA